MLYPLVEYQRLLLAPWTAWAEAVANTFFLPDSTLARLPGEAYLAAGLDMLYRFGKGYEKPAFDITTVALDDRHVPVVEQVALECPFCNLLRFAPDAPAIDAAPEQWPLVLVCAPLAGHHAVLLRDVVESLLPTHIVYVTDWKDARRVPAVEGPFCLDDYVTDVQAFIRHIGAERLHVLAICQATVPTLAAISLLASAGEPTPRSLTLMAGPVDARRNPTSVNRLATRRPLAWFQRNLIHAVPEPYPGAGRKVYPSYLQLAGLVAAHPEWLLDAHSDYYSDLMRGDTRRAKSSRRRCEDYNAVLDLAAEFYLDTIRIVFQEFRLALGKWYVRDQHVRPQDIRRTALLTIEGELDDISGRGQTCAAHGLCQGVPMPWKRHVTVRQCSHYDLFSGTRWRNEVFPSIRQLIRQCTDERASR